MKLLAILLLAGGAYAQDGSPPAAKPDAKAAPVNKEVEDLKTQLAGMKATLISLQGSLVTLQRQVAEANQTILIARICSDAGLIWAQCQVDQNNWTAKPITPDPKKP